MKDTHLSIIVPCYNEQEALPIFYKETRKVMSKIDCEYEIILVNDGSKDKTLEIMQDLAAHDERVKYISFSRNFGKEAAIYAGLRNSKGDFTVMMDADLQHPPALLPEMLNYVESGEYDSVATRRFNRAGEPPIRSFFARLFYKIMSKISSTEIIDGASDYRMMSRKFVDALLSLAEYNRFSKGLFGWVGFKTKWIA